MAISINCTCGKTFKVGEQHVGKKAKCPDCGNLVLVEEPETGVQEKKPRAAPPPPTPRPARRSSVPPPPHAA